MTRSAAPVPEALTVRGIAKSFGDVRVLESVDLAVHQSEIVGVIGPNGSGKTTLFGIIAGQLRPDTGQISLLGNEVTRFSPAARAAAGIGRCFQIPQAFVSMTVFENLLTAASFAAGLAPIEAEARALEVIERTGFAGREMVMAGALPLLDRKRLELARALATMPKVLLLDEIASGLTDDEAFGLADTVTAMRDEGITLIWVEHLMHVLVKAVDRLVVLNDGRFIADGPPATVIAEPAVRKVYLGLEGAANA